MARESRTKYAVLGMLNLGPKCGYEIKKALEKEAMFFWNESYGQIYPMLKKLVRQNLATFEHVEREDQPDMKVYTITQRGREELARWLAQPAEPHPVRDEMLLKLFFGAHNTVGMNIAHVEQLRERLHEQREGFERSREALLDEHLGDAHLEYWLLTLRYGEAMNAAALAWCDEATSRLKVLQRG